MISVNQLQEIAAWPPPILSLYLNTRTQNASRRPQVQACLAWFEKEAISISRSLLPRDAEQFERQVRRTVRFLTERRPNENAVAIFASRENWIVLPLQVRLDNELRWGKPAFGQLFRLLSEQPPSCVVVVDHHAARFFMNALGELTLLEDKSFDVDISQWKKKDLGHFAGERIRKTRGPQRDIFEHRLEAQYERLCQETAERATALCGQHNLGSIFLVGPNRLISPTQAKIPRALAEVTFLVPEDLGNFSSRQVLKRLQAVIDGCHHSQQLVEVTHLLGAGHRAVVGVDETLAQLQNGAIRTLVLARDLDVDLYQCVKCSRVNRSGHPVCATCVYQQRKTLLREILPELLARRNTKLEIVCGEAARMLGRVGGMGGWLRQAKQVGAG